MPPRPNKDRQLKSARNKLRAGERSTKAPASKNIVDQVGGWLGGAAKGVYNYSDSQARTFTNPYINAAGRAIGKNPNLPVSGAKEAITNTAWGVVDVASGPIGRAAGKGVTAVGRAVQSGRVVNPVAAARNLVKGEKVVVHGTSAKIKGSELVPKSGSRGSETIGKPVVFAHNPRAVGASKSLHNESITYANKNAEYGNYGQIVIGSAKKKDLKHLSNVLNTSGPDSVVPNNPITRKYLYSEQPIKVQTAIEPVQRTYPGTSRQYTTFDPKILQRELRKQGVLLRRPSIAQQVDDVRKTAARKVQQIKNRQRFKDNSDF
jgi:hypothetical protein